MRIAFIILSFALSASGQILVPVVGGAFGLPGTPVDNTTTSGCTGSSGAWTCTGTPTITLSDPTALTIYYSLTTTPTCIGTGTLYTGAFSGSSSTFTLKAIGCNGITGGAVLSSVYTINAGITLITNTACNVSASGCTASSSSVTTAGVNTTGANFIAVCIADATSGTALAVSLSDSKSNSWTALTTYHPTGTSDRVAILYAQGSLNVGTGHTFTWSGSFPAIAVIAFSGVASSPHDQENGAGATSVSSLQPGSITPGVANELLLACVGTLSTQTALAINSPFTASNVLNATSGTTNVGIGMAYQIQTTATAENPTWSWTTAVNAMNVIESFK
jgi:hypothetical protein